MTPADGAAGVEPLDGLLAGLRLGLFHGASQEMPSAAADPEADAEALGRVADWPAVAALAWRHRVESLLLRGMRTQPAVLAASGIASELGAAHSQSERRGLTQLGALKRATGCLAAGGIPYLVLKGLPLAQRVYGHPLARDTRDIDLLVSPQTFQDADRALLESGWKRVEPSFPETPARNRWYGRFRHDHLLAGSGSPLELHQRMMYNPFWFDVPFESLYANSAPVEIGNVPFSTLGKEDELAYLMCHGVRHCWERLKWLCDVAMVLASRSPERLEEGLAQCQRPGLESILASTLLLCREVFHVRIPPEAMRPPAGGRRAAWIAGFSCRTWREQKEARLRGSCYGAALKLFAMIARPGPRVIGHELAHLMVEPRDWQSLNLPDRLFYLYFPLRPLFWLTRKMAGRGRLKVAPSSPKQKPGTAPKPSERPPGKVRGAKISSVFQRGATQSGGMDRQSNAGELPPRTTRYREPAKALGSFVRASAGTKTMALEAALFLLAAWLLVKHVPMRRWRHRLVTGEEPALAAGAAPAQRLPRRLAYIVRRVACHMPFQALCLQQAMALQWMLRRRGVPSRLRFGVRREAENAGLDFHAWLIVSGECVIGAEEVDTYAALPPFDGVGAEDH